VVGRARGRAPILDLRDRHDLRTRKERPPCV
jgi:hypothetical protein